jgi:hypothetical protein
MTEPEAAIEPKPHISRHALARALDMGLTAEEIRDVLMRPTRRNLNSGRWYLNRGRLTAVVIGDGVDAVVTTFTWATANAWVVDADCAPLPPGRDTDGLEKSRRTGKHLRRKKRNR